MRKKLFFEGIIRRTIFKKFRYELLGIKTKLSGLKIEN